MGVEPRNSSMAGPESVRCPWAPGAAPPAPPSPVVFSVTLYTAALRSTLPRRLQLAYGREWARRYQALVLDILQERFGSDSDPPCG